MPVSLHSHFCFFCLQQYEKNIALSANLENTSHIPTSHTYCSSSSPVIYGMGAYIVMYQTHGLTPALLSLTTVGMSSQCICEKQWSVEKQPLGKHWWLFSNFGLLHQEQLAICWGQKRHTYWLGICCGPLRFRNKTRIHSGLVFIYILVATPFQGNTPPYRRSRLTVLRWTKLWWQGVGFLLLYYYFSALKKVITSTHFTGRIGGESNVTANLTQANAAACLQLRCSACQVAASSPKHPAEFPVWSKQNTDETEIVYSIKVLNLQGTGLWP